MTPVEEVSAVEVVPPVDERPVMGVAMDAIAAEAMISTAAVDVRRAKFAATIAAETSTTTESAATAETAMTAAAAANFDRHRLAGVFRRRQRGRTGERERFRALM